MVYEQSNSYRLGFTIDFFKYLISLIIISYAAYFVRYRLSLIKALPVKEIIEIVTRSEVYYYYAILALITVVAMIADKLIYKYDFTPTYQRAFNKVFFSIALILSVMIFIGTMIGQLQIGEVVPYDPTAILATAFINGIKGIIENGFFIGVIGFGVWTLLSEGQRDFSSALISSIIVGLTALAWHLYQLYYIYTMSSTTQLFVVGLEIFIFFFIASLLSFASDSVWAADVLHFTNNFALGLFKVTGYVIF